MNIRREHREFFSWLRINRAVVGIIEEKLYSEFSEGKERELGKE